MNATLEKRLPWLFCGAALLQVAIVALVPIQKIEAFTSGQTILLEVRPVDPYSIMTGYYTTMGYEISDPHAFDRLGANVDVYEPGTYYAVLTLNSGRLATPARLSRTFPTTIGQNEIVIKGEIARQWARLQFGIEAFHIPETDRAEVDGLLRAAPDQARAEVRVDRQGRAVIVALHVGGKIFTGEGNSKKP